MTVTGLTGGATRRIAEAPSDDTRIRDDDPVELARTEEAPVDETRVDGADVRPVDAVPAADTFERGDGVDPDERPPVTAGVTPVAGTATPVAPVADDVAAYIDSVRSPAFTPDGVVGDVRASTDRDAAWQERYDTALAELDARANSARRRLAAGEPVNRSVVPHGFPEPDADVTARIVEAGPDGERTRRELAVAIADHETWNLRYSGERRHLSTLANHDATPEERHEAIEALAYNSGRLSPDGVRALAAARPGIESERLAERIDDRVAPYADVLATGQLPQLEGLPPGQRAAEALRAIEAGEVAYPGPVREHEARLAMEAARTAEPDAARALERVGTSLATGRPTDPELGAAWDLLSRADPASLSQADLRAANQLLDAYPPVERGGRVLGEGDAAADAGDTLAANRDAFRARLEEENAVYARAGFSDDSMYAGGTALENERLIEDVGSRVDTASRIDVDRTLLAVEQQLEAGVGDRASLEALRTRLQERRPVAAAAEATARIDHAVERALEDQGIAGAGWDGLRNLVGDESGSDALRGRIDEMRAARDALADMENFEGTPDERAAELARRSEAFDTAARAASEAFADYDQAQGTLGTRAGGALRLAFGSLEAVVGAAGVVAPEPATSIGGALLFAHGLDTARQGAAELWDGRPRQTLLFQAVDGGLQQLGVGENAARTLATFADMAPSLLTAAGPGRYAAALRAGRTTLGAAAPPTGARLFGGALTRRLEGGPTPMSRPAASSLPVGSGGRAGIDLEGFQREADLLTHQIRLARDLGETDLTTVARLERELARVQDPAALRSTIMGANDSGRIAAEASRLGLEGVDARTIDRVRSYLFDSPGIAFTHENYAAWRRLAEGRGTAGDAAFLRHEVAEIRALERSGFDFMGRNLDGASASVQRRWQSDFRTAYMSAHREALQEEYEFLAGRVGDALQTGTVNRNVIAAVDPLNAEGRRYMLLDGNPLTAHPGYAAWQARATQPIRITSGAAERYGLPRDTTLADLVAAVRRSTR